MKSQSHRIESLEEIVFRTRNKAYGAYEIRKKYQKYTLLSLIIAIFALGVTVAYPVVAAYMNLGKGIKEITTVDIEIMPKPPDDAEQPPPPPPPDPIVENRVRFTAPIVTSDTVETTIATQDDLSTKPNVEAPSDEPIIDVVDDKPQVIEQPVTQQVFTVVEEDPSFPGGEDARIKFLQENVVFPEEARQLSIEGRVFVTFIVEPDGSLSDIRLLRGIGAGCDDEAIRVVKKMPKWIPGKQRGIPVRVQFNMPIKFTLRG
jgi:protein TonB